MSYETEVPSDERTKFQLFRRCVDQLFRCSFLKNTSLKMDLFPTGEGATLEGINVDAFKSFLVTFRQFTLNDHTNFYSTHNRFQLYCPDENLKEWVAYSRKLWKETMDSQPFRFEADGETISVEESLRLHFYSGLAHFDVETTEKMDALPSLCVDFMKLGMVSAFHALLRALANVDAAIQHFQDGTESTVPAFKSEPKA